MPTWQASPGWAASSGASISTRRSAWAHLIWPQGNFSITSRGQTACISGSARGHDAFPFRTSISMLMSLLVAGAPSVIRWTRTGVTRDGFCFAKLRCLTAMEPSIRVSVRLRLPSVRTSPMTFTLPNLPYSHDALAPHMSKETLEYHHDKHHQAYVTNGNNAIKGTEFEGKSLEEIVKGSFGKNPAVFNNAGQHYNHLHFWNWMKPNGGGSKLPGRLEKKITEDLGGLEKFKTD